MLEEARIDKWLWAVRIFKTRSLATEACKKGRVSIDKNAVKASRLIKKGDTIQVRKPPVIYSYVVKEIIQNRVGAKLVSSYLDDITTEEEKSKEISRSGNSFFFFERGKGRPTKKERRDINKFFNK